jgi:hypothetical protein
MRVGNDGQVGISTFGDLFGYFNIEAIGLIRLFHVDDLIQK